MGRVGAGSGRNVLLHAAGPAGAGAHARRSFEPYRRRTMTASHPVEILLVDDNPSDVELTIHSLRQYRLANAIQVSTDGKEALDFLFCRPAYKLSPPPDPP